MPTRTVLSTRVLLVCAAIGVATGIIGGLAGWLAAPVIATVPVIYGLILGAHVLPGIVAQEALRLPWVALLSHLLGALAASAVAPPFFLRFVGTAILFGGIQELVAAVVRYRSWAPWRFFLSGIVIGALAAVVFFFAANIDAMPFWAQVSYVVLAFVGPLAWTGIGLALGAGLRRAGVGRR